MLTKIHYKWGIVIKQSRSCTLFKFWILLAFFASSITLPNESLAQTISFNFQSTTGNFCGPATVRFTPTFSRTPITFYWQFGIDNEESDALSPSFTYVRPGTYRVTLTALFESTILEETRVVRIFESPVISLSADKNYFCKPDTANFLISTNSNLNSIIWDFGDNITARELNDLNCKYYYSNLGEYNVNVIAIDVNGCIANAGTNVSFRKPTAVLVDTPLMGCVPIDVSLSASVNIPHGSSVTSYVWNFDDGSPEETTLIGLANHTYTSANTFNPTLTITTIEGCSNSFNFSELAFGTKPIKGKVQTALNPVCASETPEFFVTDYGDANGFEWHINGSVFNTNTPSATFKFNNIDTFKVKVMPSYNGCQGEIDSMDIIIKGVIADYRFNNSCTDRSLFDFRSVSIGNVNSFEWSFGNGGAIATIARPNHRYPDFGSFPLKLKVRENETGCEDSIMGMIYTAKPILIEMDTLICRGSTVRMGVANNYENPRMTLNWNIVGRFFNNVQGNFITASANAFGQFTNRVIINNGPGYCRDTLTQQNTVRVSGPLSRFNAPENLCLNAPMIITNQSTPNQIRDSIVNWTWDFGNSVTSNLENPGSVEYLASGNYFVRLKVQDLNGCQDSTFQLKKVRRLPLLRVFPLLQKVCAGQTIELTALTKSSLLWSPSSLVSCDTCSNVFVTPTAPTTYNVTATDTFGCRRTQSVNLDVWLPFELEPDVISDTSICVGSSVPFDLKSGDKIVEWTPATYLSNPNISNPVSTPIATTSYQATVSDLGRCFSRTATATIEVNPFPVVDMGPDLVLPYNQPFVISPFYGPDITDYRWQPANMLDCNTCPEPSGRALVSTTFALTATTSKGCSSTHFLKLNIDCDNKNLLMPTAFTPDKNSLNDIYFPLTRGISLINRFIIYNRYGQVVFERTNFKPNERSFGWDGTFKGIPQPAGSYIFSVEAQCDLGSNLSNKGTVVLIR